MQPLLKPLSSRCSTNCFQPDGFWNSWSSRGLSSWQNKAQFWRQLWESQMQSPLSHSRLTSFVPQLPRPHRGWSWARGGALPCQNCWCCEGAGEGKATLTTHGFISVPHPSALCSSPLLIPCSFPAFLTQKVQLHWDWPKTDSLLTQSQPTSWTPAHKRQGTFLLGVLTGSSYPEGRVYTYWGI